MLSLWPKMSLRIHAEVNFEYAKKPGVIQTLDSLSVTRLLDCLHLFKSLQLYNL